LDEQIETYWRKVMPFYTKKPIPIEARQITAENADELSAWSESAVVRRPNGDITGMMVYNLEGTMTGRVGDYLIKGVRGEFYFCAKEIFEESYEQHEELPENHLRVLDIIDQPDGSAIVNFEMGRSALRTFAEVGLLKILTDEAKRVVQNDEDIDTNVGC
jgi:hypothetical protein